MFAKACDLCLSYHKLERAFHFALKNWLFPWYCLLCAQSTVTVDISNSVDMHRSRQHNSLWKVDWRPCHGAQISSPTGTSLGITYRWESSSSDSWPSLWTAYARDPVSVNRVYKKRAPLSWNSDSAAGLQVPISVGQQREPNTQSSEQTVRTDKLHFDWLWLQLLAYLESSVLYQCCRLWFFPLAIWCLNRFSRASFVNVEYQKSKPAN